MSKPTIIFIHGAWHSPEYFNRVIALLEPLGYKCIAPSLPSVGSKPPTKNLDQDIAVIRSAVVTELEQGNDVIVNAHSWGGIPSVSALDGLSKREREGKAGVLKLAFIAAFLLTQDDPAVPKKGEKFPGWIVDEEGFIMLDDFPGKMYHDLEPEDRKYWLSKLKPHSYDSVTTHPTSSAYKKIPSAYLVCEDDRAIPLQLQDAMIERTRKDGAVIEVERLFVSHSPYLAKPGQVAEFLRRAAGEEVEATF